MKVGELSKEQFKIKFVHLSWLVLELHEFIQFKDLTFNDLLRGHLSTDRRTKKDVNTFFMCPIQLNLSFFPEM